MMSGYVTANGLQMFFEVHSDGQPLSSVSSNRTRPIRCQALGICSADAADAPVTSASGRPDEFAVDVI
jgi:hypothetical protein